jgi:hypothetical protein
VYYVAKTPALRRLAWKLIKYGVVTAGPVYLRQEVTRAWAESAHEPASPGRLSELR